jgi:glycosyltransferase involved in cell wall biosynthesis
MGDSIYLHPLAVEDRFIAAHAMPTADARAQPYFLCVGTLEPRKNVRLLLTVWERFSAESPPCAKLILVGKPSWTQGDDFQRIRDLEASGVVEIRSGLADEALLDLMAGARALLFPSLAEGWGLPLSEALAMGLPVLASDLPVFREIGQGAPEFLPAADADAWESSIRAYAAAGSDARLAQLARMRGYQPITWDEHFRGLSERGFCRS